MTHLLCIQARRTNEYESEKQKDNGVGDFRERFHVGKRDIEKLKAELLKEKRNFQLIQKGISMIWWPKQRNFFTGRKKVVISSSFVFSMIFRKVVTALGFKERNYGSLMNKVETIELWWQLGNSRSLALSIQHAKNNNRYKFFCFLPTIFLENVFFAKIKKK